MHLITIFLKTKYKSKFPIRTDLLSVSKRNEYISMNNPEIVKSKNNQLEITKMKYEDTECQIIKNHQ